MARRRWWWMAVWSVGAAADEGSPPAARHRYAVAGLVISGHKARTSRFVEQSACAALTMFGSVRRSGKFGGDLVLMAGPLGRSSPHDPKSWAAAPSGWRREHSDAVELLRRLVSPRGVRVWDLVPLLVSSKYPAMKRNLNYMKLAVYELRHERVMFVDLDVVVVGELSKFFGVSGALVGYRTCTAPVNSGFFVVTTADRAYLRELDAIVSRNKCPCRQDRAPFSSRGYDDYGPLTRDLARLWGSGRLCANVLRRTDRTWQFAGAGTGQGLMYYFFDALRRSYTSFTYAQLPIVHYNSPGPKPWSSHATPASPAPGERQHCDFVWWRAYLAVRRRSNATSFAFCDDLLAANLHKKRRDRHFHVPSCCRVCPGGGHFATAQPCNASLDLDAYGRDQCRPASQLLRAL